MKTGINREAPQTMKFIFSSYLLSMLATLLLFAIGMGLQTFITPSVPSAPLLLMFGGIVAGGSMLALIMSWRLAIEGGW